VGITTPSVVNKDLIFKAKAKDLTFMAKVKDLTFKAKAKDLTFKAKAKDLTFKAKAKDSKFVLEDISRPRTRTLTIPIDSVVVVQSRWCCERFCTSLADATSSLFSVRTIDDVCSVQGQSG